MSRHQATADPQSSAKRGCIRAAAASCSNTKHAHTRFTPPTPTPKQYMAASVCDMQCLAKPHLLACLHLHYTHRHTQTHTSPPERYRAQANHRCLTPPCYVQGRPDRRSQWRNHQRTGTTKAPRTAAASTTSRHRQMCWLLAAPCRTVWRQLAPRDNPCPLPIDYHQHLNTHTCTTTRPLIVLQLSATHSCTEIRGQLLLR